MRLVDIAPMLEHLDLEHYDKDYYVSQYNADWIYSWLDSQPTIEAEPVKHGQWVKDGDFLICLNCESEINIKNSLGVENRKNYCPNCGCKMDLEVQ